MGVAVSSVDVAGLAGMPARDGAPGAVTMQEAGRMDTKGGLREERVVHQQRGAVWILEFRTAGLEQYQVGVVWLAEGVSKHSLRSSSRQN